eukprot:snap_masked-scaffold_51-processed-gene-1.38-mRNA-1 protein AED:1.00 eAED:1.00 QI:0/0/0/0/1/1/5/0/70
MKLLGRHIRCVKKKSYTPFMGKTLKYSEQTLLYHFLVLKVTAVAMVSGFFCLFSFALKLENVKCNSDLVI